MNFLNKKLSDRSFWNTKLVALELKVILVSVRAMLAAFLTIEDRLEILIFLVEITNELEA